MKASASSPALERRISAFLDGEANEHERQEIEALLVNEPQARALHDSLKRGTDFGRRVFDDAMKEPLPLELVRTIKNAPLPRRAIRLPDDKKRQALSFKPSRTQALVACLLSLCLGGGIGYALGTQPGSTRLGGSEVQLDSRDWLDDVVAHYRLYTRLPDRLVEIGADRPGDILAWLTTGTGIAFRIPDLSQSGLTFAGARLFTADNRPSGLLLYRRGDEGEIIAITFSKTRPDTNKPVEDIRADTGLVSWSTPLATYVVVGPSSAADLDEIAAKAAGLI